MRVIGLTGGIATGKSTVSNTIQEEGVAVVDCDRIAHAVAKKASLNNIHKDFAVSSFVRL